MGIGFACCNNQIGNEITAYNGMPASATQEYIKEGLLSNRLKIFGTNVDGGFPKYIYDFDFATVSTNQGIKNYLFLAAGGDGLVRFQINPNGRLSNRITIKETSKQDYKGKRYGYEDFKGCYGVKSFDNQYIFFTFGQDGLLGYNINTELTETLIQNSEPTIFKEVEGSSKNDRVYVGTTGYDYPVTEPYYDQEWYQPEFDYSDPDEAFTNHISYYGGVNLEPKGVNAYRLNPLISSLKGVSQKEQPFIKNIPILEYINKLMIVNKNLYVATGLREEKIEGYYPELTKDQSAEGKVYEVKESETRNGSGQTTVSFQSSIYIQRNSPCIDLSFNDNIYSLFADSLYKDQEEFLNLSEYRNRSLCEDTDIANCVLFNKDFDLVSVISGRGPVINSRNNPTSRIIGGSFCLNPNFPYGTPETVGIFGTGISMTSGKIYISLFNNGYIVVDKSTGEVIHRYNDLISIDCENFVKPSDDPLTFDYNPEYNLACGRSKVFNGSLFILDCVQFTANGSGPGVYNPIEVSNDASRFVTLIKEFEIFRGIIAVTAPPE